MDAYATFDKCAVHSCYSILSKNTSNYFDYEAFFAKAKHQADNIRELFMYDYSMGANNHVFRNL